MIGIPMFKIRRSRDRLIFNMEIPMPGKDRRYIEMSEGDRLNIKMSSYQHRDPHVKDKTVSQPSYL